MGAGAATTRTSYTGFSGDTLPGRSRWRTTFWGSRARCSTGRYIREGHHHDLRPPPNSTFNRKVDRRDVVPYADVLRSNSKVWNRTKSDSLGDRWKSPSPVRMMAHARRDARLARGVSARDVGSGRTRDPVSSRHSSTLRILTARSSTIASIIEIASAVVPLGSQMPRSRPPRPLLAMPRCLVGVSEARWCRSFRQGEALPLFLSHNENAIKTFGSCQLVTRPT